MQLPLYLERPRSPTETVRPLVRDPMCRRCKFGETARSVCVGADASDFAGPGGLYIVGGAPGKKENQVGRPLIGAPGMLLRKTTRKWWSGSVVYDNAVRCQPPPHADLTLAIEPCSGYLAAALREAAPARILCLGNVAIRAVLGRGVPVLSVRGATAWIMLNNKLTPVFAVPPPAAALRNRFVRRWFEAGVRRACLEEPRWEPPWDEEFESITSAEESEAAVEHLYAAEWASHDCETAGEMFGNYWEVATLAACPAGTDTAYVWGRAALQNEGITAPLFRWLQDCRAKKVGHNLKYDMISPRAAWGFEVRGVHSDTRLKRKLVVADAIGSLEVCSELVGMGGYKQDFEPYLAVAKKKISKARARAKQGQPFLPGVLDPALLAAVNAPHADSLSFAYALVPDEELQRYCARDVVATTRLEDYVGPALAAEPQLQAVWDKIVHPATAAVEQIEAWGIAADRDAMEHFSAFVQVEQDEVYARLMAYGEFNPNSPDDVAGFLFQKLKLPVIEQSEKTGKPSTKKQVLQYLQKKHRHPSLDDLMEFRRLDKLQSAYGKPMRHFIRADGRIHPQLKIDGTECMPAGELVHTGRGVVPVETVQTGDAVLTHKGRACRVLNVRSFAPTPIVTVSTRPGHRLRTSGNHQYWTPEGWRRADALTPGDRVFTVEAERWRRVVGWPYEVSSWGRVRRRGGAPLPLQAKGPRGRLKICLSRNGAPLRGPDRKDFAVDRLVAGAFKVSGTGPEMRHLNGCAWDNRPSNLARGTGQENGQGALRRGPRWAAVEVLEIHHGAPECVIGLTVAGDASHLTGGLVTHNTGRMSCLNPALHQIPRAGDETGPQEGKMIKDCFAAPPGYKLVQLDYSQLELRIAAMLSGDAAMQAMFDSGEDFHMGTAKLVSRVMWGLDPSQCTKYHRSYAKAFVFGLLYGMTDGGLAARLACTKAEAAQLRAAILGNYVALGEWVRARLAETRKTGVARTWWDGEVARRRPLHRVGDPSHDDKARRGIINAENSAVNTPVQGTASDFCLRSISDCVDWLQGGTVDAKLVLTVHDSIIFEARAAHVRTVIDTAREIMLGHNSQGVPLKVDAEVGPSWGSLEKAT